MKDACEILLGKTASLENGAELVQVGDQVEAGGGLLSTETTIEIGTDADVSGIA